MTRFSALLAALLAACVAAVDRLRVRWFRWRRLPTVRERLVAGALPPPPRPLTVLRIPPARAPEHEQEWHSIDGSLDVVSGRPTPSFRLASTRMLPAPLRPLSVLEPDRWDTAPRRTHRGPAAPRLAVETTRDAHAPRAAKPTLAVFRPEAFGLDGTAGESRHERAAPPLRRATHLNDPLAFERPAPLAPLDVVRPEAFGLAPDATPATELDPIEPMRPPRLPRARATFTFKYVDRYRESLILHDVPQQQGEEIEESVQGFFAESTMGASEPSLREPPAELKAALDHVREQYLLRRDIGRPELGETDLGRLTAVEGLSFGAIQEFTGLEFESLQPEPVEPLRMRLEAPPPDMAPTIEASELALRRLIAALGEFPDDREPSTRH